jgi:hypothetical protein
MNKKLLIFIFVGVLLIIIISGWLTYNRGALSAVPEKSAATAPEKPKNVSLIIDDAEQPVKSFQAEFKEEMTAFDLLEQRAEEAGIDLKIKSYDIGIMVEAIGGVENGESGKYWLYYINGEMAEVSADRKVIKPGDSVEFKFEKSPF